MSTNVKADSAWSNTPTPLYAFMAYTGIMFYIISLSRAVFFILSLCHLHGISMEIDCRSDKTQCLFFYQLKKIINESNLHIRVVWHEINTLFIPLSEPCLKEAMCSFIKI